MPTDLYVPTEVLAELNCHIRCNIPCQFFKCAIYAKASLVVSICNTPYDIE